MPAWQVAQLAPAGAFAWDGSWFGHPGATLIDAYATTPRVRACMHVSQACACTHGRYAGTPRVREMLDAGTPWARVVDAFAADEAAFRVTRRPFMLYA